MPPTNTGNETTMEYSITKTRNTTRINFVRIPYQNAETRTRDFDRHWYNALRHFNVPFDMELPWTDELDLFMQKARNYATDMVDAGTDSVKVAQVKLQHGIFIQQAKLRGGTRAGAGRPKVHGLKRRSTTATDDEWQAMISARNEIRQRNRQASRIND